MTISVHAEIFVPPYAKIAPFRRDRLLIHDGGINALSNDLVKIISGAAYKTPEDRRAVAKALALALALDPKSPDAKSTLNKLSAGASPVSDNKLRIEMNRKHLWGSLKWLSSPEAGADSNTLASLIAETVALLYPSDPQSKDYIGKPEHLAWDGWVADIAAFNQKPSIPEHPIVDSPPIAEVPDNLDGNRTDEPPNKPEKQPIKKGIQTESAKVMTVVQMFNKEKGMWLPEIVGVDMQADNYPKTETGFDFQGFLLNISTSGDGSFQAEEEIIQPMIGQLKQQLKKLPERASVNIRLESDKAYVYSKNRRAISGPAYVLAHAALTGNQPDATVVCEIDSEGKLKPPAYFWRALIELADKGQGGRLILPSGTEETLINLIALEKTDFFLKYEVLMASSVEELGILASRNVSDQHEEIYEKFKIIKEKFVGNTIGAYLSNKFVRERLQDIIKQAPYHLSSKILNIYGSVARPRYLTREALGAEIWRKVDVISEIIKIGDISSINPSQLDRLDELYEQMRDDLKDLERYTDSKNTDLLKDAKDLVNSVRGFAREFEGKEELWKKAGKIQAARATMIQLNTELLNQLNKLTGDPIPPRW